MAIDDPTGRAMPGNPADDLIAKITGLSEVRLKLRPDPDLGAVEIALASEPVALVLTETAALDMALRLIGAVARLRRSGDAS